MADVALITQRIMKECAGVRARMASRMLTRVYDAALRPLGLQASQFSVLIAVALFGDRGASMAPLAQALVMDRSTLTRNLRPLEKAGLLRVAHSATDRRARIVTLTRAGERTIVLAAPLWEKAQESVRDMLGPVHMDALRAELNEVLSHRAAMPADPSAATPAGPSPIEPGSRKTARQHRSGLRPR